MRSSDPILKKSSVQTSTAKRLGVWAEQQAERCLTQSGIKILARNYHARWGEIDLIGCVDATLIFVEVKARSSKQRGSAIEMITAAKQRKIVKTALAFVQEHEIYDQFYYRFDVICFDITAQIAKNLQQDFSNMAYDLQWIENAFTMDADLINL